tara:strand:- start:154 stop:1059 length:906 start_codon:yes stop_codon:yes gene_type:complete
MAAFTTIAAATVAIGGSAAKGIIAGDAATDSARQAGRLYLEKEKLEKEAVADLEQNFYDALRANTDIYDKQLQAGNVMGAQILEAVQEGDQRGVAAAAGKVKQVQDATLGATADKFAAEKSEIDKLKAAAGESSASEIAALKDGRAAAAGVQADALTQQASDLQGQATGSFIDAGVSALGVGVNLMGKNAMGKAAQKLVDSGKYSTLSEATSALDGIDNKALRDIARGGDFIPKANTVTPLAPVLPAVAVNPETKIDTAPPKNPMFDEDFMKNLMGNFYDASGFKGEKAGGIFDSLTNYFK